MNTEQKSLKLAELMGWPVYKEPDSAIYFFISETKESTLFSDCKHVSRPLEPYSDTCQGRAQFAAILLRFPNAMGQMCGRCSCVFNDDGEVVYDGRVEPTQSNILDEILRINGVNIDDH